MSESVKAQTELKPKVAVAKKPVAKTAAVKRPSAKAFDMQGKAAGVVALPKEIFGQEPNEKLLTQALRIYRFNEASNTANTKTRGEVRGGGAKPWRQKGTGRARAGSRRSPLWVGGGITFGPQTKIVKLSLPKKMKHKALISALSTKTEAGQIKVITNLEKVEPKTKIVANLLKRLEISGKTILVVSQKSQNIKLASRNIKGILIDTPQGLNAYRVLQVRNLLLSKEAVEKFNDK
ncbi:MAG: 50S ribosomal protein L4 [Candidatus Curtissbacteria bacterium]|nr:50S ribosomal protein L4 [Candidatus Curtissbacteria bacterium]